MRGENRLTRLPGVAVEDPLLGPAGLGADHVDAKPRSFGQSGVAGDHWEPEAPCDDDDSASATVML